MQTIPGVDFESMLSELGKFGASFLLATQSLAKLDALSETMRHTLLANVGCLAVFQVAGSDARELLWELGGQRISEDDIVRQPVHHCYVRASIGTDTLPTSSMTVRKPEFGDPERAARIRQEAAAYLTSAKDIEKQQADRRNRVEQLAAEAAKAAEAQEQAELPAERPAKRKRNRSRSKLTKPSD